MSDHSELEKIIKNAAVLAHSREHEFVTLEHLSFVLLDEAPVVELLEEIGSKPKHIKNKFDKILDREELKAPNGMGSKPRETSGLRRVCQRAVFQAEFQSNPRPISIQLLFSLLKEEQSVATSTFVDFDVTAEQLNKAMTKKEEGMIDGDDPLTVYCQNLNERAMKGKIDPVIGRETEIIDMINVLALRKKNNVVLVGEPGVGKTAVAEGFAKMIVEGEVPHVLKNKTVLSLDMGTLVAGTRYRGDFEDRLKAIIKRIKARDDVILFIDEIHQMLGAGASSGGTMDAGNILKPELANGELSCIGSTTYDEYHQHFEKDRALARRFQKLDIEPPSAEDTKRILHGLKKYYEEFHGVTYEPDTLDLAVDLSERYIHNKFLPDKAIDIMDAAGARAKLRKDTIVTVDDIQNRAAKLSKVSIDMIDLKENTMIENLNSRLKDRVYGQDDAIDVVTDAIIISKSGLRDPEKPILSALCVGPTGVGKTWLAKKIAELTGAELIRFDMSEYQEQHSASKLIGAPPGYVGHDEGQMGQGQLIGQVEEHPHSILLLDEIEKAHPSVVQVLLQVLDDGRLTSNKGKVVRFNNCIILMTSNLGAADAEKNKIGFGNQENVGATDEAVKKFFAPEFRNRLDSIIRFNKLTMNEMELIVQAIIQETNAMMKSKDINILLSPEAKMHLMEEGYDDKMGARPLKRLFQEKIKKPLSREILFGDLQEGGTVSIDYVDGDYKLNVQPLVDISNLLEE